MEDGLPHEAAAQEDGPGALRELTLEVRDLAERLHQMEQQVSALRPHGVTAKPLPARMSAPLGEHLAGPPSAPPQRSLEDRLGSQLFNLIGMIAILFGAAWALKLAIDHGLLGPAARIIVGLIAGSALVVWSESFRRHGTPAFSYTLKAVGSSVLYLSLWAGFQIFHLFPSGVTVVGMLLVTTWNGWMAWSQEAELLGFYALLGGLLTPVLLSTGADAELFLFSYLALVVAGTVALLRLRPWPRLLLLAFPATVAYFAGYFLRFFHQAPGTSGVWESQSTETLIFALVFCALFALPTTRWWKASPNATSHNLASALLPLGNAAFAGCALGAVLQASGLHAALPWLMLVLAAASLALVRLQQNAAASAANVAAAVVLLTVAIPLKASGHPLTTAWLAEGLALLWIACRIRSETSLKARWLTLLSGLCYALGLGALAVGWLLRWGGGTRPFFTADLATALVAIATLAGATWLAFAQTGERPRPANLRVLLLSLAGLDAVALLLASGELGSTGETVNAFADADFFRALLSLGILGATAWTSRLVAHPTAGPPPHPRQTALFRQGVLANGLLFNLMALFTLVRETSALWPGSAESLERSLAISGVLMAYAAALLALGFWRQQAFVRWQALILLLVTIAKVFFSDISGLSAGYRVASFLALGALLLGVSFAYQKDWLSLQAHNKLPASGDLG